MFLARPKSATFEVNPCGAVDDLRRMFSRLRSPCTMPAASPRKSMGTPKAARGARKVALTEHTHLGCGDMTGQV